MHFVSHPKILTRPFKEYLISKYGQGRFQPSEAGHLDNLFCEYCSLGTGLQISSCCADSHYTEGTLMPLLVNLYIYNLIPQQVPWILRPVFRFVFGALSSKMIEPRLIIHANYVSSLAVAIMFKPQNLS